MSRGVRGLVYTLLTALLVACSLSRELRAVPEALQLVAPPLSGVPAERPGRRWQLQVEPVVADPLRGGRRILRRSGAEIGAYAGVAWVEPAAGLWQRLLVQGLQPRLPGVASANAPLRGDCRLLPTLSVFEVNADAEAAQIVLELSLLRSADGRLLAQRRWAGEATLSGHGATALAGAFQHALEAFWPTLVDWALRAGDAGCDVRK